MSDATRYDDAPDLFDGATLGLHVAAVVDEAQINLVCLRVGLHYLTAIPAVVHGRRADNTSYKSQPSQYSEASATQTSHLIIIVYLLANNSHEFHDRPHVLGYIYDGAMIG